VQRESDRLACLQISASHALLPVRCTGLASICPPASASRLPACTVIPMLRAISGSSTHRITWKWNDPRTKCTAYAKIIANVRRASSAPGETLRNSVEAHQIISSVHVPGRSCTYRAPVMSVHYLCSLPVMQLVRNQLAFTLALSQNRSINITA